MSALLTSPSLVALAMVFSFALGSLAVWRVDVSRLAHAHRLIAKGAPVVDVDTPDVFARDHVRDAINIPLDHLERRANELDPTRPVVVYGRGRLVAARATHTLRRLGFFEVVNMGSGRHEPA